MRILLSILFIFILFFSVYGQINNQNSEKSVLGDTTFWYDLSNKKIIKLKLSQLISCNDEFHFRLWANSQVVDIWTNNNKEFHGLLTNYAETYEEYNAKNEKRNPSKTFSTQIIIDTTMSRKIYDIIKPVLNIPQDDSIKGWNQGNDGITYIFETTTLMTYSFKTYWTPQSQDSTIKEVKQILTFINNINFMLNLKFEYESFFETLKPGSYSTDNSIVITKLTEKQKESWKKYWPHKTYLDSVRDTLNNYLTDTLTKIFQSNNDSLFFGEYILKFSTKNKLLKIRTNEVFYSFSSRLKFYNDRKKIRKAFRKIQINFVHSKIKYWKELNYLNNKIFITQ